MNVNNFPLWTALVTPLNEDLSVNWQDLESLVRAQEEAKIGLLVLGSTGEALNLDLQTKEEIVIFVKGLNPKVPIMVGVAGQKIEEAKNWIHFLEQIDINAYLMVTPIYSKPGKMGQYHWFKELMDLSTKPVMLYNVPSRSGTSLNIEAVKDLRDHNNFWAIKEASGSVADFKEYVAAGGKVFSGDDAMTSDFCNVGGAGLISVAANIWPKQTALYVEQCLNKSLKDKQLWVDCSHSLFTNGNPVTPKRLMLELKLIATARVLPPLSHLDISNADMQLTANKKINDWYDQEIK
jgi:4-hydroxy-tetrahydrodipicolinate synthase